MTTIRTEPGPTPASYDLGATGTRGVWLGLGTTRVAVLGVGLLTSVAALTAGGPGWLAVVPMVVAFGLVAARIGGRALLDWTTPVGARAKSTLSGITRWTTRVPTLPVALSCDCPAIHLRLPTEFGRLSLAACPDDPAIGVLSDPIDRTVTVVFEVCGVDRFPLLDPTEQDTLVAGWGDALAVLADTDDQLRRLQLIERAASSDGLADPYPMEEMPGDRDPWMAEIETLTARHHTRLAAQWSFPRLDSAALATVLSRCQLLSRTLLSARLLTRPLTVEELRRDLAGTLTGHLNAGSGDEAGPLSRRADWTQVWVDDRVHRSFAVTGWPTSAVGAAWLSPLVLSAPAGVTRTVSLHLERVPPAIAARVARTRRAKAVLDQSDRARLGMTSSAALLNAEASGVAMDAELAAGYRTHRLAGLVTLSADTVSALDGAGQVLRQAAAVCRLDLRPLHGQHEIALAATAPLCRLRHRGQS